MNDSNDKTIQAYEAHVQEYIDGTPTTVDGVVKDWIDEATSQLALDARILEFGSAFGRDAAYLQGQGFSVECTDATQAFVDLLKEKGFDARHLNAITDDLDGPYDLVLANAVLLHFTRDEVKQVLAKVHAALKPGGTFAFTVKQGEGEKWVDDKLHAPRYFCFWTEELLQPVIKQAGFAEVKITGDQATRNNTKWLQIIARKAA
jgi:SAM-dependent methyltransferase